MCVTACQNQNLQPVRTMRLSRKFRHVGGGGSWQHISQAGRMDLPREAIGRVQLLLEGVHTSISKETYRYFAIFKGGGGGVRNPTPCIRTKQAECIYSHRIENYVH